MEEENKINPVPKEGHEICRNCQKQVSTFAVICPYCGVPLSKTYSDKENYLWFAVGGFTSAFLAFWILPIFFAPLGVGLGLAVKNRKQETIGIIIILLSVILGILGFFFPIFFIGLFRNM